MLTDSRNYVNMRPSDYKFVTELSVKILAHHKCFDTLFCEIFGIFRLVVTN